ncbi:hypothetical protein GH733_011714 [Mirounga leonina]|nr:hypothetical protein GH733_011714 [Mirounga leonina]
MHTAREPGTETHTSGYTSLCSDFVKPDEDVNRINVNSMTDGGVCYFHIWLLMDKQGSLPGKQRSKLRKQTNKSNHALDAEANDRVFKAAEGKHQVRADGEQRLPRSHQKLLPLPQQQKRKEAITISRKHLTMLLGLGSLMPFSESQHIDRLSEPSDLISVEFKLTDSPDMIGFSQRQVCHFKKVETSRNGACTEKAQQWWCGSQAPFPLSQASYTEDRQEFDAKPIYKVQLWGPQESPVNLKAPTSGYSLPLFALNSAHRRPPWLRIQGWASLLYAWPGEVGTLHTHLVGGRGPSLVQGQQLALTQGQKMPIMLHQLLGSLQKGPRYKDSPCPSFFPELCVLGSWSFGVQTLESLCRSQEMGEKVRIAGSYNAKIQTKVHLSPKCKQLRGSDAKLGNVFFQEQLASWPALLAMQNFSKVTFRAAIVSDGLLTLIITLVPFKLQSIYTIAFLPTVTLAQMVSLNDEPRVFSIVRRHCKNLSAAGSSTLCSVYPRECVRKFRMKIKVWHLTGADSHICWKDVKIQTRTQCRHQRSQPLPDEFVTQVSGRGSHPHCNLGALCTQVTVKRFFPLEYRLVAVAPKDLICQIGATALCRHGCGFHHALQNHHNFKVCVVNVLFTQII